MLRAAILPTSSTNYEECMCTNGYEDPFNRYDVYVFTKVYIVSIDLSFYKRRKWSVSVVCTITVRNEGCDTETSKHVHGFRAKWWCQMWPWKAKPRISVERVSNDNAVNIVICTSTNVPKTCGSVSIASHVVTLRSLPTQNIVSTWWRVQLRLNCIRYPLVATGCVN